MKTRACQRGITTVEVAIVGLLAMITLFGVLEIARAFFVLSALQEATRRGARVAAVCQVNDPAVQEITVFGGGASTSTLVGGLTTANAIVEYLDPAGNVLGNPTGSSYGLITYVRVRITGFLHQLLIPLFVTSLAMPDFQTTLPAESLGVWPGGFSPC